MERDRVCFLHIGTHKTGTTSLQRMLAINEKRLGQAGVHIPSSGRPSAFDGHHNVAWELNGDPRFNPACGTLLSVTEEISRRGASTACLSSEDFEYLHAKSERLHDVARAFEGIGYAVKIILYVRPRDEYERSLYHELSQHHGIKQSAEEFHMLVARDSVFHCRDSWIFQFAYDRLVEPFAQAFGPANVIVRDYCSTGPDSHLLADFLQIILRSSPEVELAGFMFPERLNRTTTAK